MLFRSPHLLSALDYATGVAAQRRVAENSNEAPLHGAGAAIAATITASAGRLRRAIESLARIASAKACPPRYDPPDPRTFSKAERRPARFERSGEGRGGAHLPKRVVFAASASS